MRYLVNHPTIFKTILSIALFGVACTPAPEGSVSSENGAPFIEPSTRVIPTPPPLADPIPVPPPATPPAPLPVVPTLNGNNPVLAGDPVQDRRQRWLTAEFQCRAISTVRFRKCRFEQAESGYSLSFQNDVRCSNVTFDENGDPETLTGCRSAWLSMPSTVKLKKAPKQAIWSGSHSGWRWKSDSEAYCCPGVWLQAPAGM